MEGTDIRGQSPTISYMLGNVAISPGILITASIHICQQLSMRMGKLINEGANVKD